MNTRYSRQTILPELGPEGQARLHTSSVLCIGVGGLGCPALLYLAAAGIGRLGLVDGDRVDTANLQRQVLFCEKDRGALKVDAAARALQERNSVCQIETYAETFQASNAQKLLESYDVIVDGTDNFASKFLINDACVKYNKPLVYGAVLGFKAQVALFYGQKGPCYRCLYYAPPAEAVPTCAEAGVMGAVAGLVGTVQALEALKAALGIAWCREKDVHSLLGRLWIMDSRSMMAQTLQLDKDPTCLVCSKRREKIMLNDIEQSPCPVSSVHTLTSHEAEVLLSEHIFIDVREAHELKETGRIRGARHVPLATILACSEKVEGLGKEDPLIIYCLHGKRSHAAAEHLQRLGYRHVSHLAGGITAWEGPLQQAV